MPRIKKFDLDPANADADGIADALPTGTAWAFGTDAEWLAVSAGDGLAHQLVITTAGDEPGGNAPVLTLTGTDADGNTITDSVTLPNATTVETAKYFLTVISAAADAATIDTMDIGWVDEISSKTIMLNRHVDSGASFQYDVSGTISLKSQVTFENIRENYTEQESLPWATVTAAVTADSYEQYPRGAVAARIVSNSYTDTAEVQVFISEERRD